MQRRAGMAGALWRALRPHQWAKNLLVFVPLALTPALHSDTPKWMAAAWAFAAWSSVASAGYLVNDWLDLRTDRADPVNRRRPLASGALPIRVGLAAAGVLAALGLGVSAALLPLSSTGCLAVYVALTLAYSLHLKRLLLIDVLLLASFYTLRLLGGGATVDVALTPWLLAFSLFLFLGLAFAKRYGELRRLSEQTDLTRATGRAYRTGDLELVMMLGTASTYLSVLVLCLYINSADSLVRPAALWFLAPILLYWVSRIWFLAKRGELPGDPVAFAVRDRVSLAMAALMGGVLWVAIGG